MQLHELHSSVQEPFLWKIEKEQNKITVHKKLHKWIHVITKLDNIIPD